MCSHPETSRFHTQESHIVCQDCGAVLRHFFSCEHMVGYEQWKMCPMTIQYTRVKRFETLLDNVVLGLENRLDYKVLQWIGNTQLKFENKSAILLFLKTIPFTDKRYCSLHLLARAFCTTYKPPPPNLVTEYYRKRSAILKMFTQIEHKFFRTYCGPFLNYKFILVSLLFTFHLGHFVQYVKPIKSRIRIHHNLLVWNALQIKLGDTVIAIPDTDVTIGKYCAQPEVLSHV
mgnify:CR=1 FL=1